MCCSFSRKTNRIIGLILLTIFIGVSMGCFIYSIATYNNLDSKYNPNQLSATLGIAAAGIVFFFTFLGVSFLCCDSKFLAAIFVIGWIGLFLLAFVVGIICLVLSVNANIINSFTCSNMWKSRNAQIDKYMALVDENLCSQNCPCDITQISMFSHLPIFQDWTLKPLSRVYNFQSCPFVTRNATLDASNATDFSLSFNANYRNQSDSYDEQQFFDTWKYLENRYKCSGFCNTTYINSKNKIVTMYKYLFSDINYGIPQNKDGCYKAIVNYTASYFSSYGSYILIISIFMLLILINLFSYLCSSDPIEDKMKIILDQQ